MKIHPPESPPPPSPPLEEGPLTGHIKGEFQIKLYLKTEGEKKGCEIHSVSDIDLHGVSLVGAESETCFKRIARKVNITAHLVLSVWAPSPETE